MKIRIIIALILFPCFAFAAADPVGMFQGAVNPYETMGQGAVQELTIIAAAAAPPAAAPVLLSPQLINNVTWFICDEVYAWSILNA